MNSSLPLSRPAATEDSCCFRSPPRRPTWLGVQSFLLVPAYSKGLVLGRVRDSEPGKSRGKSRVRGMRHMGRQAQRMATFGSMMVQVDAPTSPAQS